MNGAYDLIITALGDNTAIYIATVCAIHVWLAICIQRITRELNRTLPQLTFKMFGLRGTIYDMKAPKPQKSWLAWIPIANLYLLYRIAEIPLSWRWFLGISIISILLWYIGIIVWLLLLWFWIWFRISPALGKPWWFGLLMLIPVVDFAIIGMLAFPKKDIEPMDINPEQLFRCSKCGNYRVYINQYCPNCGSTGPHVANYHPRK